MTTSNSEFRLTATVILAASLLISGCSRKEETTPGARPVSSANPGPVPPSASAEKTSFQEVTSQLDPGGNLFAYFGTEQWISGVSQQVSSWRGFVGSLPNLTGEQRANANKGFDLATRLIKNSGIEDISGVGMSGIAQEKGFYRTKLLVHHYPGRNSGYIWSVFGAVPHSLDGIGMLPSTTALSSFSDLDLHAVWAILQRELSQSGIPELEAWTRQFPGEVEKKTGLNLESALNSLGGESGIVLTLDETRRVTLPIPLPQPVEIPEPHLALVVKVKNDAIFDWLDKLMQSNPQVARVDEAGLRMRTMPVPVPLPFPLRPTVARAGDYLFLASSDTIIREMLAVRDGKQPGLKSTDEFKRMARGIPDQGNSFAFVSPRFSKAISDLQVAALSAAARGQAGQATLMQGLFSPNQGAFSYSVSANTAQGWLAVGNGSSDPSKKAIILGTMQPAAVVGLLSAIAIPNFVKARGTAQQNAIINNLRMLDGAKDQWALENNKKTGDPVTKEDLAPYLRGGKVSPVAGETYSVNPIGQKPTATASSRIGNYAPGATIKLP